MTVNNTYAVRYSSDSIYLKEKKNKVIKTYYARHLKYLREAVPPRFIRYIDSSNNKNYKKLLVEGLLFTVKAINAKHVYLIASINRYRKVKMIRNFKGIWYLIVEIPSYNFLQSSPRLLKYKFLVDGLYQHDKTHSVFEDDKANGLISIFRLNREFIHPKKGIISLTNELKFGNKLLFRIFAPSASHISLIGNFNNWNPNIDILKKNTNGYFEMQKSVPPGKHIYQFRIDGENHFDKNNKVLKHHPIFGSVSYFEIK